MNNPMHLDNRLEKEAWIQFAQAALQSGEPTEAAKTKADEMTNAFIERCL